MANLGFLLVCTFGNFPAPVLVAAHTVNNFMNNALKTRVTKKTRIFCVWCPDTKRFLTKRKKDVFFVGQSFIKKKKEKKKKQSLTLTELLGLNVPMLEDFWASNIF